MLLKLLLHVAAFPSDSEGPAADDIHDVLIIPATAVIPDFNGVPAVVCLPARCWWLHCLSKRSCFT